MTKLLEARDVVFEYHTRNGVVRALDAASLSISPGEIVGLVGESGSGKSTLGIAMGGLVPRNARVVDGDVLFQGTSLLGVESKTLANVRRQNFGFVFQDAVGTLNPSARIGRQIQWTAGERVDARRMREVLLAVKLNDPDRVLHSFPHQLSGGMAQRVSIALAILRKPRVIVADEPTAALDASVRRDIMELLVKRCRDDGIAMLLTSHDLKAVRRYCDRVAVAYGGRVVETAKSEDLFHTPTHPYTRALLGSALGTEFFGEAVTSIAGVPPALSGPSLGCAFHPRCAFATDVCVVERPDSRSVGTSEVLCHLAPVDGRRPQAASIRVDEFESGSASEKYGGEAQ